MQDLTVHPVQPADQDWVRLTQSQFTPVAIAALTLFGDSL